MIQDLEAADEHRRIEADLCIVGAGAAGITLALELAGSGRRICLLESGGFEREEATQQLYAAENVGADRKPLVDTRLRYFGGTTNHWVGQCAPLETLDFRRLEWVPHSGWPIGASDLREHYPRAARLCRLAHTRFDASLRRAADASSPAFRPDRLESRILQFSPPVRFGPAHREQLERAPDVRVLLHANATGMEIGADARRIRSVEARSLSGRRATVKASHFVLACGAIENARLLLLTTAGSSMPIDRHGLVGRFLMDHTFSRPGEVFLADGSEVGRVYDDRIHEGSRQRSLLVLSDETRRRERVLGCNIQLREGSSDRHRSLVIVTEQAPDPESRVTLGSDRDALGLPRARVDWRLSEMERRTVQVALRLFGAEIGRLGLGRVRIDRWVSEPEGWRRHVTDYNHHMGTTRMDHDPRQGVVDADCRVHGADNLFVAGSSVFPTGGTFNPTLTILALALRLADHLRRTAGPS